MSESAAAARKPKQPMLLNEATVWLFGRLQDDPRSRLQINVDHGQYRAMYVSQPGDPDQAKTEGEWIPNLTDALASLIGLLP